VAGGSAPFSYQWYFNTNSPIANATNSTLTLTSVQSTNVGAYSVVVSNSVSAATSESAMLAIPPAYTPFQNWQLQYFTCTNNGTSCTQAAPNADPYGKGISNYNQFLAGLNPTNPASVFSIIAISQAGGTNTVTWKTSGGDPNAASFYGPTVITNIVQGSDGAANGGYSNNFSDISSPLIIVPPGDTVTNYPDASGTNRFYRIRLGP
jgi:hypothetical protein